MSDLTLCGARLRSTVPLPELPAWSGDRRPPEINFRLDPSAALPTQGRSGLLAETPFLKIAADRSVTLDVPMFGRITVRQGREAVIAPRAGAPSAQLASLLLGPALTLLCRQQGRVVLRAACVQTRDGAVAFAGKSRAGKSTLAAALSLRGYRVLADDVCVVDAVNVPTVLPVASRVALWHDSATALGLSVDGLVGIRTDQDCYAVVLNTDPLPDSVPLCAVYILNDDRTAATPAFDKLANDAAADAIRTQMRAEIFDTALGQQAVRNDEARTIAEQVSVHRFDYRQDIAAVNLPADAFAARHAP